MSRRRPTRATVAAWREYCEAIRPLVMAEMLAELDREREMTRVARELSPGPVDGTPLVFNVSMGDGL